MIVAGLATLITPYAGELWLFLRTALTPRLEIAEWNPIVATSPEGVAYIILLTPTILGWMYSRREKRPVLVFLYLVAALLPLVARRHSPLFALALVILAGEHMADAASRLFCAAGAIEAIPTPMARAVRAARVDVRDVPRDGYRVSRRSPRRICGR